MSEPKRKASDPKEISRASMQEGDLEYDRSRIGGQTPGRWLMQGMWRELI